MQLKFQLKVGIVTNLPTDRIARQQWLMTTPTNGFKIRKLLNSVIYNYASIKSYVPSIRIFAHYSHVTKQLELI